MTSDELLLFPCSHGEEEPERATVPFIPAATAAVSGHRAIVLLTVEGSWLGVEGIVERIHVEGMPALAELWRQLVEAGGEVWVCSACAVKRGITENDLAEGARIVGAAQIVEAMTTGRALTLG